MVKAKKSNYSLLKLPLTRKKAPFPLCSEVIHAGMALFT